MTLYTSLVSVLPDSPLASVKDLIARLRKDPASVSFGFGTSPGNQNHVVMGMMARAAKVDPKQLKTVIFIRGTLRRPPCWEATSTCSSAAGHHPAA